MGCEIKRMLTGRIFWLAVLLAGTGILMGAHYPFEQMEELLSTGSFIAMEKEALLSKNVGFLLPVVVVIPWSSSFLEEYKNGFLKAALPRTSRRNYTESKILTVALAGFLVWILAAILVLAICFIGFFPMEEKGTLTWESLWELTGIVTRQGLLGAVISNLGGVAAVLTGSGYMAFGLPLVGYYFCMILHERYFSEALWLYPAEWISCTAQWGEKDLGLWLFLLIFLYMTMMIHGGILYEKIKEI